MFWYVPEVGGPKAATKGPPPEVGGPKGRHEGSHAGRGELPVDVLLQHERGIALVFSGHQQVGVVHGGAVHGEPVNGTHKRLVIPHQLQ